MKITGRIMTLLFTLVCFIVWNFDHLFSRYSFISFIFFGFVAWNLGKQYDKAQYISRTDILTGLYNRRFVYEKIPQFFRSNKHKLAVLVLDCDNFKAINDTYGHQTGDWALKRIAKLLSRETRSQDLIARFGGDEFLVLAPYMDDRDLFRLATQLELEFHYLSQKTELDIQVSIGIARYPEDADTFDDLIRIADKNMYLQKETRKNSKSELASC